MPSKHKQILSEVRIEMQSHAENSFYFMFTLQWQSPFFMLQGKWPFFNDEF